MPGKWLSFTGQIFRRARIYLETLSHAKEAAFSWSDTERSTKNARSVIAYGHLAAFALSDPFRLPLALKSPEAKIMAKIDKLLKQAKGHFDDGECALQTVRGVYETTIMGSETVRNGIFIATDQRLLFYAKKLTGYDIEVFPYANISSIEMGKKPAGSPHQFFRLREQRQDEMDLRR